MIILFPEKCKDTIGWNVSDTVLETTILCYRNSSCLILRDVGRTVIKDNIPTRSYAALNCVALCTYQHTRQRQYLHFMIILIYFILDVSQYRAHSHP